MGNPFDAKERRAILDEILGLRSRLYDLTAALDSGRGEVSQQLGETQELLSHLMSAYEKGVPVLPLSRCPFTGQLLRHSIDHFGLDGLWWDNDLPVRPNEDLPETYFALAGAVSLSVQIEEFPFVCKPGPGIPYVVPRLLELPEVKAVVSSVQVGPHRAFPIFYYARPIPYDVERINTWGAEEYGFLDGSGNYRWNATTESPEDLDFDLEVWIKAGKLLWIPPGDSSLTLRSDIRRCPYLSLEGERSMRFIQDGKVWS